MSKFLKIPYRNYRGVIIVNTDELRKIELKDLNNDTSEIIYYLKDKEITQKFDFEYDVCEEHEDELNELCPSDCHKIECNDCEIYRNLVKKYEREAKRYNRKIAKEVLDNIEKQLEIIDLTNGVIEGEVYVSLN